MMKSKHHYACLFAVGVTFIFITPAHSDCYATNFPEYKSFIDEVISLEIKSEQYKADKLNILNEIALTQNELNTNDTNLTYEYDVTGNSNSLNLTSDLSFWKWSIDKQITEQKILIKEHEILELNNSEYADLARSILSILSANLYLSIFLERDEILKDQINYYSKRIKMGSGEFQEKLEYEQDLIELRNKKMSAEIKKQTEILMSEISAREINLFKSRLNIATPPSKFVCPERPAILNKIDQQKRLVELQIIQQQNVFSPGLLGSVGSVWDEDGNNNIAGKLVLNIPIYQGNKKNLQVAKLKQELLKLENTQLVMFDQLNKAAQERSQIDRILMSSLISIDAQIFSKKDNLKQLALKKQLGGSVYQEEIQIKKEITLLQEARVGLVVDIFSGWLNFMSARGELYHDHS
jgi:hypothetical protein